MLSNQRILLLILVVFLPVMEIKSMILETDITRGCVPSFYTQTIAIDWCQLGLLYLQ